MRILLLLILMASDAAAEGLDPKLVDPTINAMQAMIKLRDTQLNLMMEQVEALRAKCGDPCKEEKKDANPTSPR